MDEWLLPSGTLKAFAEYMPLMANGRFPDPDEREAARLEQAVDAARKAKDAPRPGGSRRQGWTPIGSQSWIPCMLPWSHGWFHGGL